MDQLIIDPVTVNDQVTESHLAELSLDDLSRVGGGTLGVVLID